MGSSLRDLNSAASRCSTWLATSLIRLANDPVDCPGGRVADEDPEAVGRPLDVVEQRQRRRLEQAAGGRLRAERHVDPVEEGADLAVDDDRVQALLAPEVLVDDRLRHARLGGDLLDAGALETLVGEQLPADLEQLLATLRTRHPGPHAVRVPWVMPPFCRYREVVTGQRGRYASALVACCSPLSARRPAAPRPPATWLSPPSPRRTGPAAPPPRPWRTPTCRHPLHRFGRRPRAPTAPGDHPSVGAGRRRRARPHRDPPRVVPPAAAPPAAGARHPPGGPGPDRLPRGPAAGDGGLLPASLRHREPGS